MKQWGGTGIIARIPNDRIAQAIIQADVPTIALGLNDEQMEEGSPLARFSELSSDPQQVASLAANHLLERQFSHFAYVGLLDRAWSTRRERAFRERLAAAGFEPLVYVQPDRPRDRVWEREQTFLADWISDAADAGGDYLPAMMIAAGKCWRRAAWQILMCRKTLRCSEWITTKCFVTFRIRHFERSAERGDGRIPRGRAARRNDERADSQAAADSGEAIGVVTRRSTGSGGGERPGRGGGRCNTFAASRDGAFRC